MWKRREEMLTSLGGNARPNILGGGELGGKGRGKSTKDPAATAQISPHMGDPQRSGKSGNLGRGGFYL